MNLQIILGQKIEGTQRFLEDGTRIPVTSLWVLGNTVISTKSKDKHAYSSLQLGFGIKKNTDKASLGHIKGAGLKAAPKFLREVKVNEVDLASFSAGDVVKAPDVFKPGDIVDVTGISKGKGFAGVVKRHHFKGGPRTHGQSDRERAPGSIGQTTTPGRVYKGKRMAGRMGHQKVTIKNLEIVGVSEDTILIKGLVPGGKNTLIMVKKVGENKKFVPLFEKEEKKDSKDSVSSDDVQANELKNGQLRASEDAHQGEKVIGSDQSHSQDDAQPVSDKIQAQKSASLSDDSKTKEDLKDKVNEAAIISSPENGQSASTKNASKDIKKKEENAS